MPDLSEGSTLLEQLVLRLQSQESLEIEFKRGRGGLPTDLCSTVSAFAKTNGGWILVGVREQPGGAPDLEGLTNPDARLQDFYNQIRNPQRVSSPVCGAADATIETVGGARLLVIRVPAASRRDRPVYIGRNPYEGTYVRRHSGDFVCSERKVKRMMREASDAAADSALLTGYGFDALLDGPPPPAQPDLFDVEVSQGTGGKPGLDGSGTGLDGSTPGLGTTGPDIDASDGSLDDNGTDLGTRDGNMGNSGDSLDSSADQPMSFTGTKDEWGALHEAARSLRKTARTDPRALRALIVEMCAHHPLAVTEIGQLLGRTRSRTRLIVRALVRDGLLTYLYPDTPRTPNQRYVTTPTP